MDPDRLDSVFRERPALHRFPGSMARRVQDLCGVVARDYGNDAEAIWRDAESGEEWARRLRALPGFGEGKTRIMVSVLGKRFGVRPPGWEAESAHWHSIADVDSPETMAQAREVKRAMKKDAGAEPEPGAVAFPFLDGQLLLPEQWQVAASEAVDLAARNWWVRTTPASSGAGRRLL